MQIIAVYTQLYVVNAFVIIIFIWTAQMACDAFEMIIIKFININIRASSCEYYFRLLLFVLSFFLYFCCCCISISHSLPMPIYEPHIYSRSIHIKRGLKIIIIWILINKKMTIISTITNKDDDDGVDNNNNNNNNKRDRTL